MDSFEKQSKLVPLIGGLVIGLIVVVSAVLIFRAVSNRPDSETASESTATAQSVVSPTVSPSVDTTVIDEQREALLDRVETFSSIYYSYDWSNPAARIEKLRGFILPAYAEEFLKQEEVSPIRQRMIALKDVKTVDSVSVESGEIGHNLELAEVKTKVEVTAAARGDEPEFSHEQPSHTLWALLDNEWYVYEIVGE